MTDRTVWVGVLILLGLVAGILYVLFGQITVRKLRKNPATKNALGLELVSGWDIVNAAQALALPRSVSKKLSAGPLQTMEANAEVLHEHTSAFDRLLARTFYWTLMIAGFGGVMLVILNAVGFYQ